MSVEENKAIVRRATEELPRLEGVDHHFVELSGLRVHVAEAGSGPGFNDNPYISRHAEVVARFQQDGPRQVLARRGWTTREPVMRPAPVLSTGVDRTIPVWTSSSGA